MMVSWLALIAAASAGLTEPSHASNALTPSKPSKIDGVVAGTPDDLRTLREVLGESLARQGLILTVTRADRIVPASVTRNAGPTEGAVAHFSLDLTALPIARLYLTDADRRRVHVRWLSVSRGLDPVSIELLRFVIESSVEAIRAGRTIGVSREEYETSLAAGVDQPLVTTPAEGVRTSLAASPPSESPASLPPPPPSPSPSPSPSPAPSSMAGSPAPVASFPAPSTLPRFVASAAYEGAWLGGGKDQQGPGLSVSLRLPQLWLGAWLLWRLPTQIGGSEASGRVESVGFRLTAAALLARSGGFSLALGGGAGIDVSQIRPGPSRPDLAPDPPSWATTPFARVFGVLEYRLGLLAAGVLVGADFDLLGERYVVGETAGADRAVFVPWRLRPLAALMLGISW